MNRSGRINLTLVAIFLLIGGYVLIKASMAQARSTYDPRRRGMTPREMFSRGAIRGQQQRKREKLRQLRIQEVRMPRDIRAMTPVPVGRPGDARPEILDYLGRSHTRFISGGWLWNNPVKGFSYTFGDSVRQEITDPEGATLQREEPITEWWELSERTRGQRAEFFRARFGAAQQLEAMPTEGGELPQPGGMEFTPSGGGMMPGGVGLPGGSPEAEFLPAEGEEFSQLGEMGISPPDTLGMMVEENSPVGEDLF